MFFLSKRGFPSEHPESKDDQIVYTVVMQYIGFGTASYFKATLLLVPVSLL